MSIETEIVDAILARVATIPEIKYKSFDDIKIAMSEFGAHELPAVQLWDNGQTIKHERGRILVDWNLSLELIMKSDFIGEVQQKDLFELRRKIQLTLWDNPNLGVSGVVHMIYTNNITDLHLLNPYYIARIDFTVRYYDKLVSTC